MLLCDSVVVAQYILPPTLSIVVPGVRSRGPKPLGAHCRTIVGPPKKLLLSGTTSPPRPARSCVNCAKQKAPRRPGPLFVEHIRPSKENVDYLLPVFLPALILAGRL